MTQTLHDKKQLSLLIIQILLISFALFVSGEDQPDINIMGPLYVGNLVHQDPQKKEQAWKDLQHLLRVAKQEGVNAVTTDIWWGLVEANGPGQYDWAIYDRLVDLLREEGLKWQPLLSFHQLGGNVGDTGYIPLPTYIWDRYKKDPQNFPDADAMKFKSEQGNISEEYVSFWATPLILDDLKRFMANFRDHFARHSAIIDEINISMGPAGELRYPSYNQHDAGVSYPSRGAIQAYSYPAIEGFRNAMRLKYGTLEAIKEHWGFALQSFNEIFPPNPDLLKNRFWSAKEHFSPYGRDFFDYYNEVLIQHGRLLFEIANEIFGEPSSPFKDKSLSGKIPGIHWQIASTRLAELCAGLIRTSYADWYELSSGYGYADTLRVFETKAGAMPKLLIFTAIEMSDYRDEQIGANSRAKSLVAWIARAAHSQNIALAGENALGSELSNALAWENMAEAILRHNYQKVTLLRLDEIAPNPLRIQLLREFHKKVSVSNSRCHKALNRTQTNEEGK